MIPELLAAVGDRDVLARIGGRLGEQARVASSELAAARDPRATRAAWIAAVHAPVPAGMRGIDATWIEAALRELPAAARRIVADAPRTPTEVWLARYACAQLPPLPVMDEALTRPRSLADAVRMAPTALLAWLDEIGADQLAFALGASARALSPRMADVAVRITQAPRAGELGDRRAAVERAHIAIDETATLRIAARALAAHASPLERLQLAHRVPRPLGRMLLDELATFAGTPLVHAPTWRALAAA